LRASPSPEFAFLAKSARPNSGTHWSRESRSSLTEPSVVTLENRPFSVVSGGEIPVTDGESVQYQPYGRIIEAKPGAVKDGKLRLDITLSNTTRRRTDQGAH
jgi:hypothetical protein